MLAARIYIYTNGMPYDTQQRLFYLFPLAVTASIKNCARVIHIIILIHKSKCVNCPYNCENVLVH